MKKITAILFLIIIINFSANKAAAEGTIPVNTIVKTVPSSGEYSRTYRISAENLMYLLLSALNEQNYSIEEIQFKTGCVLFKAYTKEFIASIASQDGYNSFIKIIPADNIYNYSPGLIQKLHTYIENNNKINFQKLL